MVEIHPNKDNYLTNNGKSKNPEIYQLDSGNGINKIERRRK
jgi:hypothetical protein